MGSLTCDAAERSIMQIIFNSMFDPRGCFQQLSFADSLPSSSLHLRFDEKWVCECPIEKQLRL